MSKDAQSLDMESTDGPVEGTTTRFTLPAEEFAFAPVFECAPDASVELEPTATDLDDHALVNVTTTDCDRDRLESALQTDSALADIDCIAERTDGWTYRLHWDGRAGQFMQQLVAEDATLLTAQARKNRWSLHVLTPDRDTLSHLYDTVTELGYTVECRRITAYEGGESDSSALTEKQQETLTTAYEAGYYHIPQDITADELADKLGISHQALSERLHRAYEQLVGDELMVDDDHRD